MDDIVRARAGLGDLPARLRERPCVVAYFGASVTVQRDGYRPRLHEWLSRHTGQQHRAVNAAIGATGSVSAVFLADELVLQHHPDLCFLDYSHGDIEAQSPGDQLGPAVEGLLRKLRSAGCEAVILHSYRYDRRFDPPAIAIERWERVADHYGIPSINVGRWVEHAIDGGRHSREELFYDGIHTTGRGAEIVSDVVTGALAPLLTRRHGDLRRPGMPAPLFAADYTQTRIVPAAAAMARDPANCIEGRFRLVRPYVEIGADNAVELNLGGALVGIIVIAGAEPRPIRFHIGGATVDVDIFDANSPSDRFATAVLPTPASKGTDVLIEGPLKLVGLMLL